MSTAPAEGREGTATPGGEGEPLTSVGVRRAAFATMADLSVGHGLEIGPLAAAIATKATSDVSFVDVEDRASLAAHYALDPGVDVDLIPEIDYTLHAGDRYLTLAEAASPGAPYDWVVASHVVEHVPDLVGWLTDVTSLLRAGDAGEAGDGRLLLVVPDRRVTFDALRPLTTVGQVLEAHDRGDRTPSLRAVFDHFRSMVDLSTHDLWAGVRAEPADRHIALSDVMTQVELARAGDYVDAHVWTFTPLAFVEVLDELARMGTLDLRVAAILPTAPEHLEFYVALEPIAPGLTAAEREAFLDETRERLLATVAAAPSPAAGARSGTPLAPEALAELEERQRRLAATADELHAEIHRLRTDLAATRASSRWRAGGVAVVPAARARAWVGKAVAARRGPSRPS